jgi:hypothetical protein
MVDDGGGATWAKLSFPSTQFQPIFSLYNNNDDETMPLFSELLKQQMMDGA